MIAAPTIAAERPNVLVIMADDLGYNDLGFHGSETFETPHLDAIAKNGIIFKDAHTAASVCSPSRAGFITGRYQQRFGHEANCPPNGLGMDTTELTMGQAFQGLGYSSYLVGKWHLGNSKEQYPTTRGFDEFYGLREGSRSFFCKPNEKFNAHAIEHNGKHIKFEGHLTDRMTDEAIRMIGTNKEKPFFMFLSYTAPHGPLQATPKDLAKADGDPYRALVQNMDDNIGRLVADLKKQKRYDNTIIWFLSDNGGTSAKASNYPLNGKKGIKLEGGQRVPFVFSWPAQVKTAKVYSELTSAMDIFPTSLALAGGDTKPKKPFDGINIWPHLTGEDAAAPHDILFWKKLEAKAVRQGDWKLILSEGLDPMLFDLGKNLGETKNLAKSDPETVTRLTDLINAWEKGHIPPLWKEGKKYIKIRKESYGKFIKKGPQKKLSDLGKK